MCSSLCQVVIKTSPHSGQGDFPRARPILCTPDVLTTTISPNVGNLAAEFVVLMGLHASHWGEKRKLERSKVQNFEAENMSLLCTIRSVEESLPVLAMDFYMSSPFTRIREKF